METDDVVDQKGNKDAYVKKMKRQIAEGDARIRNVERIAAQRDANKNPQIKKHVGSYIGQDPAQLELERILRGRHTAAIALD